MHDAHLALRFSVSPADTLDTLEAALAIARRGGLQLAGMHVQAPAARHAVACDEVFLQLRASDADRLDLFLTRLRKLYCAEDIVVLSAPCNSPDTFDTHQTQRAMHDHTERLCLQPTE